MTSSVYLYGTVLDDYKDKPYEDVLFAKVILTKALLKRLVRDYDMAELPRINKVLKACEFNKLLLIELGHTEQSISTKIQGK